jgi:hypothetical protein
MCSIEGCEKPIFARGWCHMHWTRWRRYGDTSIKKNPNGPKPIDRFMRRVSLDGDCWVWQGGRNRGYGAFDVDGKRVSAHRWSYEHFVGPIPPGMHLDHFVCERAACVNPAHLRPVSPRENTLRSDGPAARNRAKTHCPAGHPYDEANTYMHPRGIRCCRACSAERHKRRNERLKRERHEARAISVRGKR